MTSSKIAVRLGPDASERLHILARAALDAGGLARDALKRRLPDQMVAKAPRDYQTEIDTAVERRIVGELAKTFPDYAIQGEEDVGNREATGMPMIVIDPIDGTTNYAWGLPHFGMTISIVEGGTLVCGVVYDSMLDELFSAEIGKGAYLNGERLTCVPMADVPNTLVGAGLPIPGQVRSVSEDCYWSALRRLTAQTAGVRRLGSSALSIAYVACGRLDGFFEDGLSLHDYGASALLVSEAGGKVTGFSGGPVGLHGDVLAANPALHGWLLDGFR